jgi:hypothetical protein
VRCGSCRKIFNASGHLVRLEPAPFLARPGYELDENYDPMKGPQTMTLRRPVTEPPETPAPTQEPVEERSERLARASFESGNSRASTRFGWVYAGLFPILLVALAAQGAHYFRSQLAASLPVLRQPLEAYCDYLQCRLEPLRDAALLTIEASDLQADPAHKGLIVLSVTLRNRGNFALAFPNLELTLTDALGQAVARRVLTPESYLRDAGVLSAGIATGDERTLKLFLHAGGVPADGYKIERYYP